MRRSNRKQTTAPTTIASCSCTNCQAKWLALMPTCRLSTFIAHLYRRCSFVDTGELRSEEQTSELQSHSFISYAVFFFKKKTNGADAILFAAHMGLTPRLC